MSKTVKGQIESDVIDDAGKQNIQLDKYFATKRKLAGKRTHESML